MSSALAITKNLVVFLSASLDRARASTDNFFCLQATMNCGAA